MEFEYKTAHSRIGWTMIPIFHLNTQDHMGLCTAVGLLAPCVLEMLDIKDYVLYWRILALVPVLKYPFKFLKVVEN